jgi:2-iminobutanoate/2-iminopropanoate deaminase
MPDVLVTSHMHILARSIIVACAVTACAHPRHGVRPVFTPEPGPDKRPFSEVVRVGRMLYLSGQLGTDSSGKLVSGGIKAETRQSLENIKHVLEANGSSMDDIVKCTAMLADINDWPAMNEVYVTFFPNHFPARSSFATNGLVMGGRVEIECMATRTVTK